MAAIDIGADEMMGYWFGSDVPKIAVPDSIKIDDSQPL